MATKAKQWGAIIVMIALFAMIAFVTNLCSPMAVIVKNQFGASNFLSQIGNYGNFIAYLIMGIPSGMLIKKFGYKKTSLIALAVGIIGILVQWASGKYGFGVYLIGAFISGFCMCMLNTVVNPMLNLLGGGGNKGNQLIQIGGVFNSAAAVAVYIIMGALIADATKAKISDATPALLIALAIFVIGFIVILFTKIEEPQQPEEVKSEVKDKYSAFSFRHFKLGILAIFLYGGIEVGTPTYIMQYLTADTEEIKDIKANALTQYSQESLTIEETAKIILNPQNDINYKYDEKDIESTIKKINDGNISIDSVTKATPGRSMKGDIVGLIVAVYWLMMLIGRFIGGAVGSKVSSKTMVTTVSIAAIILVLFGMFAPTSLMVKVPGIDWANLSVIWAEVPVGIFAFILVGLCTSVMWGAIFNLATEGLGKYTAIASGAFMTMVFGFAIMVGLQGAVADWTGNYMTSYVVVLACAAYILFYALIGSKNVNKDIPVE